MSRRIIITEEDMKKLKKLVDGEIDKKNKPHVLELDDELKRAEIVDKSKLPNDVITMNSRAILLLDDIEETVTLVYPHEADMSQNNISVLSPIGTAIIGYREGDTVEWAVPSGVTKIDIRKVIYQPESEEDSALSAE